MFDSPDRLGLYDQFDAMVWAWRHSQAPAGWDEEPVAAPAAA